MQTPKLSEYTRRFALLGAVIALLSGALAGCSSGGGNNNTGGGGGGGGGSRFSAVAGQVTDAQGAPIVGANITIGSLAAITTQFGNFIVPSVPIPSGQVSQTYVINASAMVNGVKWTGSNVTEAFAGVAQTNSVGVVLSAPASQGSIAGRVTATSGAGLSGASVYASIALPPVAGSPTVFSNLASFLAITDANGNYTLPQLPPSALYLVVASYPGKLNGQQSNVVVSAGASTPLNFTLSGPSGASTTPVATGLFGISITYPSVASRAAGIASVSSVNALARQRILQQKGWANRHVAIKGSLANSALTRSAPAGTSIENITAWDYAAMNNLYGYVVLRSIANSTSFVPYAVLQDALAERFSDSDTTLTPDTFYYYSIARLDTINYPAGGAEGDPVIPPIVVEPLGALSLVSPASNSAGVTAPVLSWAKVNRATLYQILVYDKFPTLQSDTDLTNGVQPIWPADSKNPGTSLITNGSLSQAYQGPALISGRQYFWTVLASDNVGSAFSVSPLFTFTAK